MALAPAYGVVILPPPGLNRELLHLRNRHPLFRSLSPPHITVKSPFAIRGTAARVVDRLEELCTGWEPFELQVGGLGSFGQRVIYVDVEPSSALQALHDELINGLSDLAETFTEQYEGPRFSPHLTIAEKLSPEDFAVARTALQGMRIRHRFTVDRIHLLKGRGSWQITRTIPFGL